MLVDNDELFLRASARSLRHQFLVATAASGEAAFEILRTHAIDVAIIDYQLEPGEADGLTLVAHIRDRWPAVRCVLCSSYATVPLAAEAMRRGAEYVANKDATIADVIAALDGRPLRTRLPSLDEMERELVRRTLAECGGNKSRAARRLGITRQRLHAKLARWASRTKPDG